jgi:hypothetical protein
VARWKLQRGDRCPTRIGDGDGSPALRLALAPAAANDRDRVGYVDGTDSSEAIRQTQVGLVRFWWWPGGCGCGGLVGR